MSAVATQDEVVHKHESETPHGTERIQARKVYVPLVDIVETDQALLLIADMPGVDQSGVDVNVEKDILTIKGTVGNEVPEGSKLSYEEYGIGDYERSFPLLNEIDTVAFMSTITDCVLRQSV